MKIFYLCHRIPYPPNKGDKIRSFNEIKHLAKKHELHLAFLIDDSGDLKHVDALREHCAGLDFDVIDPRWQKVKAAPRMLLGEPLSIPYFYSAKLQRDIDRTLSDQSFDAIICFSGPMAEYVFKSKALGMKSQSSDGKTWPLLIMDFCDVDSDKWGQYAANSKGAIKKVYALEQKRLLAYEAQVNRAFDSSVFITEQEARLFQSLYPAAERMQVVGNGVDIEFFDPGPQDGGETGEAKDLVFTGAMDYHANVDAVSWFCRDILPQIRRAGVGAEFCIVGGKPAPAVQELARIPGVCITGFVDDIRSWYRRAAVSVIPLRLARGVQNKVLEAMAMCRPVVTTRKAADSIGAIHGEHLFVADDARQFADTVADLWNDSAARRQLGREARKFVVENFDWDRNMEKLEKLLVWKRRDLQDQAVGAVDFDVIW